MGEAAPKMDIKENIGILKTQRNPLAWVWFDHIFSVACVIPKERLLPPWPVSLLALTSAPK